MRLLATPKPRELRLHPVADILPRMPDEQFGYFVQSIRNSGLRDPIIVHPEDGSIINEFPTNPACTRARGRDQNPFRGAER